MGVLRLVFELFLWGSCHVFFGFVLLENREVEGLISRLFIFDETGKQAIRKYLLQRY